MSLHETTWHDVQDLYRWPSPFVSSPDILTFLSEAGARASGSDPDKPSCVENANPSAGGSSRSSNAGIANQQLMRPPPMRPRSVYENIYCIPLTQNISGQQWYPYGREQSFQEPHLPQDIAPTSSVGKSILDKGPDDNRLLEELAASPNLDTDPSLVVDLLSSEENGNQKPGPESGTLTLDTNFANPAFSSPLSLPSCSTASLSFSDVSAYSEASFFSPAYTPQSSVTISTTPVSPAPSPVMTRTEAVRGACPARVTPSPRAKKRGIPYHLDDNRNRWSTGSVVSHHANPNPTSKPRFSPPSTNGRRLSLSTNVITAQPDMINSAAQISQSPQITYPTNFERNCHSAHPVSSKSPSGFLSLQKKTTGPNNGYFEHHFELPGPPDLFGPLKEEQLRPPAQDMVPKDPSMMPREEEPRFENDLYTPRWVRGQRKQREAWCGICKPGRWLILKTSAFWYDKTFTHGICATTGQAFAPPIEMRRSDGQTGGWEGLCGTCREWHQMESNKKKGTAWFKHAYKCHQNGRSTETSKPRRNGSNSTAGGPSLDDVGTVEELGSQEPTPSLPSMPSML